MINCWGRDRNFSLRLKYYPDHILVKDLKTKNICTAYIGLTGLKVKERSKSGVHWEDKIDHMDLGDSGWYEYEICRERHITHRHTQRDTDDR